MKSERRSGSLEENVRVFALDWITRRMGSPVEFIRELEEQQGWQARNGVLAVLAELRRDRTLENSPRKFLNYTLSEPALIQALNDGSLPGPEHASCLDELFTRSRRFRNSRDFAEAVDFLGRFHEYSPFNNMLVYLQNPLTTYFATAAHWQKAFGRTIREEARGMIILAPRTPVLLVYDIADTNGPKLPARLDLFSAISGKFHPRTFDHTAKNCQRDRILIERKPMGKLRGGFATARINDPQFKIRIVIREELDVPAAYSVLCHELAHVYLGHLGASRKDGWPYRLDLSNPTAEIEAEAVAHIVCRRAGLETRSAEYLSKYIIDDKSLSNASLDLISRVAGRIEEMGRRLLPPRETGPE
jgi:hypothetical protein